MSLPPPGLPPDVFARSRAKAVAAELDQQSDPKLQAALLFELGSLAELRLDERALALGHYREAAERDPSFRPALFALARQQREARDDEALLVTLAKLAHSTHNPTERASILVDMGCLLEDQLGDVAGAQTAFERALEADPSCLAASLMRERGHLSQHQRLAASRLLARRTEHTLDPALRAALAVEAARDLAADGDIDAATEVLLTALAAPSRKLPILLCLSELTLRHGRSWVAARACEDMGALLAGFAADQTGPEPLEIATHFADRRSAIQAAAYYYHAAARLHANAGAYAQDELAARARAAACLPSDVLLGLELAAAYRSLDAPAEAQAQLKRLLRSADSQSQGAARLQFELAELAARQGDDQAALMQLRAAYAAAPNAPSIHAVLEDRLLDAGELKALGELLLARAGDCEGAERRSLLWRAALAAERADDSARALAIWSSLASASAGPERAAALREQPGLASRAQLPAQLTAAAEQLLACPVSPAERSALLRSRYEAALAQQDLQAARGLLELALQEPSCDVWAPHTAWLMAGLQHDEALLVRAHDKLALLSEAHEDSALAAAHRVAQGRSLLRCGAHAEANSALRKALELSPGSLLAVNLLEHGLLARGETAAAIDLLRASARAFEDRSAAQLALLQAAELAEASGQLELARHSYDEAAARDPAALAPQWARLRFAERSRDRARRLSALQALVAREAAQRRPGQAHLELGEALLARGQHAQAVAPLTAAIEDDSFALEAAASLVLMPGLTEPHAVRIRALSELAERAAHQTRRALEHERSAELLHVCPEDARKLQAEVARGLADPSELWLRFMLQPPGTQDALGLVALRHLTDDLAQQAQCTLHASRCRTISGTQDDTDALLAALALVEDYPDTLGSALALCEALDAADDPDTRVIALAAYAKQLSGKPARELCAALARAQLDAGCAELALASLRQLQSEPELADDPSLWESLRVTARVASDWPTVVAACEALARQLRGPTRAALLEEAAAVLHERLGQREQAERKLRELLAEQPDRKPAFERMHDILIERADLDGLLELLSSRIALCTSSGERVDLLYEKARILRARGERKAALTVTRELLAREPAHTAALSLCAEIQASEEDWLGAVDALRRLSMADLPAAQRRLAIEGCADFLEQKLGDPGAAYHELQKLLRLDLADFSVHSRMAELAELARLPLMAAQALCRAAALSRGAQRAHVERRAATLFLAAGEPAKAKAALERALIAHPLDERSFNLLLSQPNEPRERDRLCRDFTDALRQALASEPSDAELLRSLWRVGQNVARPHLQRLGLFALEAAGLASPEELACARKARGARAPRRLARFGDARFTRVMPPELNADLLHLGQVLGALWMDLQPDGADRHGLRRRARLGPQDQAAQPARARLRELLALFGLELGELYASDAQPRALFPLRSPGRAQSWVISRELLAAADDSAYLRAVPFMAAARAGLLGLYDAAISDVQGRARLLLSAAGVIGDAALAQEQTALASKLSQARRAELAEAWQAIARPNEAIARLSRGCVLLGQRATLVVAQDPVLAQAALGLAAHEPSALASLSPGRRELLRFWLSAECSDLIDDERAA